MSLTLHRATGARVVPQPHRWIRLMLAHIEWLVRDWAACERRASFGRFVPVARAAQAVAVAQGAPNYDASDPL